MSSRTGLRLLRTSQQLRTPFRQTLQRRGMTTQAEAPNTQSRFSKFWNNPVGPKTVHFWAPVMKWAIVLAGVSDFFRPVEKLSLTQNMALTATGAIWTRWCLIIKPRNVFLATVNFFLFLVGCTQVTRITLHNRAALGESVADEAKDAAKTEKSAAEKVLEDPKGAMKNITSPK